MTCKKNSSRLNRAHDSLFRSLDLYKPCTSYINRGNEIVNRVRNLVNRGNKLANRAHNFFFLHVVWAKHFLNYFSI